jgi:hypothetical protein
MSNIKDTDKALEEFTKRGEPKKDFVVKQAYEIKTTLIPGVIKVNHLIKTKK